MTLSGCNSVPYAGLQTLAAAISGSPARPRTSIPGVSFLRVANVGSDSFLVLGDADEGRAGPLQVWYSAGKQVLRLHQGRVAGTAGLTVDWTGVDWRGLPSSWAAVGSATVQYLRVRDVMPGHRVGVRERVTLARSAAPAQLALPGVAEPEWRRWVWFTEEATPLDADDRPLEGGLRLPPAVYAVDVGQPGEPVRYSRQCLAPDFCLVIQPWKQPDTEHQSRASPQRVGSGGSLSLTRQHGRS
jgi:hypothetical protein